jgi:hypothetical protein
MKNKLIKSIFKFFNINPGKLEYVVTVVNVSGEVKKYTFKNIKDVNGFVTDVNSETYWNIQSIEKIKRYEFTYNREVIHSPLFFTMENVTEKQYVDDHDYSFLIKNSSLKNIRRVTLKD